MDFVRYADSLRAKLHMCATADELQQLNGVGPALAQRIVDDRKANGAFATIEDLKRVSGIGDKKFASLADSICVG